jgi:hypothetical protein
LKDLFVLLIDHQKGDIMDIPLPEETVRMIKQGNDLYFHQIDICRILEKMEKKCQSLDSKAMLKEALRIFSCTVDPFMEDDES